MASEPTSPAPKAEAAPVHLSVENAEISKSSSQVKLPLHEDAMQLARIGEIAPIKALFDQGKIDKNFCDEEGITPLHWAAINNHFALCRYLLQAGVDVNAQGGNAAATPAMWAVQRCNYYLVHLLLESGADPLLTDNQGYNSLHLATFDGNVFLILLLLHQNIPVDGPEPMGHTCLMWAAYKGYEACVDLYLRWGASVTATDAKGFTALHWALVKGSQPCIQKLIEYGSDRSQKTSEGKTPLVVATEMNSTAAWYRALDACGYDSQGDLKKLPFSHLSFIRRPYLIDRVFFLFPFPVLFIVLSIVSGTPVYFGLPVSLLLAYSAQLVGHKLLQWAPPGRGHIHKTPFLAGIFAATCFWVGVRWLLKILPNTFRAYPFANLFFATVYGLCAYFYTMSILEDPGYVPRAGSRSQQKTVMDELLKARKFDDDTFCTLCMIRTPLRSKHCKKCQRCVAKHDHHCPWIHNCVGSNNLRHFVLYIITMEVGILLFLRLVVAHLDAMPTSMQPHCSIFSGRYCEFISRDSFTTVLAAWAALQLTWVTMLLFVQLVQISRATTTYENMTGHGHHHDSKPSQAINAVLATGMTSVDGIQMPPDHSHEPGDSHGHNHGQGHSHKHPHDHSHNRNEGCFAQWKKLLGLDTFVATAQDTLDTGSQARWDRNPYSRGCITNCRDFWLDPAPYFNQRQVGAAFLDGEVVNYAQMYESPPRMRMHRAGDGAGNGAVYERVDTEEAV